MNPTHSVVVVDDHGMFRTGVKAEIGEAVDIVGEAADVDEAVKVVLETLPDVVLLDVHLPGGGGSEVVRRVHLRSPEVKFLALSVSDAAEDVIGVIRAGARGYVTKNITGPELVGRSGGCPTGMPCSVPGWRVSCSTPSPAPSRSPTSTSTSTG